MLNIDEIHEEITKLENCNTSQENCKKLAILYIVRDHFKSAGTRHMESPAAAPMSSPSMMK